MIAATLSRNIEVGAKKRIKFSTELVTVDGGQRMANARWSYPLHEWDCTVEPQQPDGVDVAATVNLFYAAGGKFDTFLLHDFMDDQLTLSTLGVGDGVTTTFQAIQNHTAGSTSRSRKITRLTGSPKAYLNGVEQMSGVAINVDTGAVVFTPAVPNGVTVALTSGFLVPVAFTTDTLEITALTEEGQEGLYQIEPFTVEEVRE